MPFCFYNLAVHNFKTLSYDILVHFFVFHDKMYKQGIVFAPLIGKYLHKLCYYFKLAGTNKTLSCV